MSSNYQNIGSYEAIIEEIKIQRRYTKTLIFLTILMSIMLIYLIINDSFIVKTASNMLQLGENMCGEMGFTNCTISI